MTEETFNNTWPKSTRLNKENRELFVRTVLADLMPDDKKPTDEKFSEQWAEKVYDACYGPHLETMKMLPTWMFKQDDELNVNPWFHHPKDPLAKKHEGFFAFKLSQPRMMINEEGVYRWSSHNAHTPQLPPDADEIVNAYRDYCQAQDDWSARQKELTQTLTQVAEACNTSHQLFRAWPQALKYAQKCFPYVEPAEAKRGGQTTISADQLDLTAKLAQTIVGTLGQN